MSDSITYKGKDYKVRVLHVEVLEHDYTTTYNIADETLLEDMMENTGTDSIDFIENSEEFKVDNEIYHYVEKGVLELSAIEICKHHLDIPMRFISEE